MSFLVRLRHQRYTVINCRCMLLQPILLDIIRAGRKSVVFSHVVAVLAVHSAIFHEHPRIYLLFQAGKNCLRSSVIVGFFTGLLPLAVSLPGHAYTSRPHIHRTQMLMQRVRTRNRNVRRTVLLQLYCQCWLLMGVDYSQMVANGECLGNPIKGLTKPWIYMYSPGAKPIHLHCFTVLLLQPAPIPMYILVHVHTHGLTSERVNEESC